VSSTPGPLLRASAKFLGLAKLAMAKRLRQQREERMILAENKSVLSLAAHKWLLEARLYAPPHDLHLLTLASWGLENGVQGEWPERDRPALEEQVGLLFGWKPQNVLRWLLGNQEAGSRAEQAQSLLKLLHTTDSPKAAAANVLNAIYSRQVADNPALQPAASELQQGSKSK
jgi:hypothetical protein